MGVVGGAYADRIITIDVLEKILVTVIDPGPRVELVNLGCSSFVMRHYSRQFQSLSLIDHVGMKDPPHKAKAYEGNLEIVILLLSHYLLLPHPPMIARRQRGLIHRDALLSTDVQ